MGLLGRANPNPIVTIPLVGLSTSDDVVTGVSGKKIKVLAFILTSTTSPCTAQWEDGATDYTGDMELDTGPVVAPYNEAGWFTVTVDLGLDITITALASIHGSLTYVLVD